LKRTSPAFLAATSACWAAALGLWWASGRISLTLLLAPLAWWAGSRLAGARRARLEALVEAALTDLVSEDGTDFDGAQAQVLARRSRLIGLLPPRLVELRLLRMPTGAHYAVRAETAGGPVRWRVQGLSPEQAQQWSTPAP